MANKKTAQKKNWKRYILFGGLALLLLVVFTGYKLYQLHLDRTDAFKFMTLQSDFKKLQMEFNKIDPGWEYSEGCSAAHFTFGDGQPSCEVALKASDGAVEEKKSYYLTKASEIVGKVENEEVSPIELIRSGFTKAGSSYCAISFGSEEFKAYVRCSSEAREFYFQRTDR